MTAIIISIVVFLAFLIYETHQFRKEYKILKKFSINNGEEIEYYFVIQRNSNKKTFKARVKQEIYDIFKSGDYIVIS